MHYEKFADGSVKCIEDEIPFELPDGWAWARIGTICIINPRNNIADDLEVSFIPMPMISEGYVNTHTYEVRTWNNVKSGFTHFAENDIGIAKITPCFENRKSVIFKKLVNGYGAGTTELHILRTLVGTISNEYLLWIAKMESFIQGGVQTFSGAVGQQRVGKDFFSQYLIPIPPHNEQIRIVNKINLIFNFVITMENEKSSLHETIKQAKSKILDLAIRGQLVPQNPDDEPASVLLERIRAEKEELIKQGKIKRDKKESIIFKGEDISYYEKIGKTIKCIDTEISFEIPNSWLWCRLDSIGNWQTGSTPSRRNDEYYGGSIPWIKTGDLNNGYIIDIPEYITEKALNETAVKLIPAGTVLIAMYGATIGKVGITTCEATTNQACCACCNLYGVLSEYLFYYLQSQKENFINMAEGGAQPNISKEKIVATLIPVPPYEQQIQIINIIKIFNKHIESIEKSLN